MGVEWDVSKDEFIFTFSDIIETVVLLQVTKRNIFKNISYVLRSFRANMSISFTSETFMYIECTCILNVKWDELLSTESVVKYNNFVEELRKLSVSRKLSFIDQHYVTEFE